ncbi:MAG: GatB/YqeY domain-containing protein, partial [Patescibacteria group bacterium]
MKARDIEALNALRYLLSLVRNSEIDLKHDLSDEEFISLLQKEVKRRREAIEQFKTAGRQELVATEETQLTVLMQFLPKQMSKEEIEAEVTKLVAELPSKGMSIAMREIMPKFKGRADGKIVFDAVKVVLQQTSIIL